MQYCHACGCKLSLGIEKFCPEFGQNLTQKEEESNRIGITNTTGDVIGVGIEGTGHIIGKDIDYTVYGNVIQLNISGGNSSHEMIDILQKIMNTPTQIDQKSITKDLAYEKDITTKLYETNNTQKQITTILQEITNIEKKEGIPPIEVIKAENIQISRKELLLKEHILKGNEYFYEEEYNKAIQCYDKALEIDPNHAIAWNNKGFALGYPTAIAWNNKGNALENLGNHEEAIQCYDKAIEIYPNNDLFHINRKISLRKLKAEKKLNRKDSLENKKDV